MTNKIKVLSLFDGMSVAQQSLKNIGADVEVYYASEIDEYAKAVTQSNFPNTRQVGSVIDVHGLDKGTGYFIGASIDLLCGGSPCQDLSIAKKNREGLKGERSGLFYEYVRIRDGVQPKYFILENVASMPKEAKEQISEILGVQPVMINASLVSAQNRKRLFWVGKWNGEKYEQVKIPQPDNKGILLKDILEENVDEKYFVKISERYGLKGLVGLDDKEKSLTASCHKGYGNDGVSIVAVNPYSKSIIGDKARALNTTCGSATTKNATILYNQDTQQYRRLTPLETLRLQSMPDDYFDKALYKNKPISNTQRYKMCGNAFNCAVIEHILKHLDLCA
jgi:DNA-cytosine methyltransferase